MANNSENFAFGAFETGSSSGGHLDKRLILSVTSPVHVRLGQFEVMSSSVEDGSSGNRSRFGGFGELPYVGGVPENQSSSGTSRTAISYGPSACGIAQNLVESPNFETRTPLGPSSGITQNLIESVNFETRTTSGPSISDVNHGLIINSTHAIHFELGSNQPNSSSARGQNIRPRRGRPQSRFSLNWGGAGSPTQGRPQPRFDLNRDVAASSTWGQQSTCFNQDLRTSINYSSSSQVVAESGSSRQPIRVAEHFTGEKRLHSKMAEREDWTENEIAIVEKAIKIPCNLKRPIWLSRISGLLETKTALDVAIFLQYFMIERNAKRIKVDQNGTSTGNNRQENMHDPSPSSSRLAGSFGPHAQDSTSSNQAMGDEIGQLLQPASAVFPLPVITEETTNAAPLDFRTNEELVNSVSSPTFDLDLPDLPFSPREILEDLAHLSFPPETAPGEPENPDLPSGSWL